METTSGRTTGAGHLELGVVAVHTQQAKYYRLSTVQNLEHI